MTKQKLKVPQSCFKYFFCLYYRLVSRGRVERRQEEMGKICNKEPNATLTFKLLGYVVRFIVILIPYKLSGSSSH